MLTFIDYFVLALVAAAFVGAIVWMRRRKKQGKGCCGNCAACAGCSRPRP